MHRGSYVFAILHGGPTSQTTSGNAPLRGFKAQTWEGGIRVPFIVKWKGRLPAGRVDDRPVIQLDILPTALAAAGVEVKPEWKLDGVNLLPYLNGQKTEPPHEALYWRLGGQLAIRKGDWKLVKAPGITANPESWGGGKAVIEGAELYNLARDIGEKHNLAPENPEKFKELAGDWNRWNAGLAEPRWRPGRQAGRNDAAGVRGASSTATNLAGPWRKGDALIGPDAPRLANRALVVSAEIEPAGANGVIIAQGAGANGYVLYLNEGKPAFALRSRHELTKVTGAEPLGPGHVKIEARLAADGAISISVDGRQVATGHAPGLIAARPGRGLTIGSNPQAVGDYPAPNPFAGTIEKAQVRAY